MEGIKLALFAAGSLGLADISRSVLLKPNTHGFYRFFAWELILAVVAINLEPWFANPFSWQQIFSWTCLAVMFIPYIF